MKKSLLVILILLSVFSMSYAQGMDLTLDDVLVIALRDNPDILLGIEDVKKAQAKVREAKASLLPSVNFSGTWSDTRGLYSKDIPQNATQTTLKQYLFKGGRILNSIAESKYNLDSSEAALDVARLEVGLSAEKAFYTLLLAKELVSLNRIIVDNTQEHLNYIKERYNSGEASESDMLNLESSLDSVKQAYEETISQFEAADILLKDILNIDRDTNINPVGEFSYSPQELAYDEAFVKAMKDRPEIREYEAKVKANEKSVAIAKGESLPTVYASWDYYTKSTSSLSFSPTKGWQDYNIIGLTLSWPVFDGWATKAKVQQALADLKTARIEKSRMISDIISEVRTSYLSLKDSMLQIKTSESQLAVFKDNLSTAQDKFEQGIVSSLDLDDAKLKHDISMFNKKQSVYDYFMAKSSFEKATGGI
ncbi:MAG: TolC family protein [Candidatus Omnitrophota bacterium]|nr:MAG: TolC family protein [Candidatus Omnitrophota bacterium]